MQPTPRISVLTATLNAADYVGRLANSLTQQSDQDFEWIVVDGNSVDDTKSVVLSHPSLRISFESAKDFGIYDALNRGLGLISSGYYLVIGADDVLAPDAIENYRSAIRTKPSDIISAAIIQSGRVIPARSGLGWLYGMPGVAGSHSIGMIINVDLHKRFGLYSKRFPIAADQYFIKTALAGGASIYRCKFVAGEFSNEGTSGSDHVGLLTEVFRVQVLTERYIGLQIILFFLRLGKLYLLSKMGLVRFTPPKG